MTGCPSPEPTAAMLCPMSCALREESLKLSVPPPCREPMPTSPFPEPSTVRSAVLQLTRGVPVSAPIATPELRCRSNDAEQPASST